MTSLLRRLAESRQRHIASHARPYLDEDEAIDIWVRARHPSRRSEGFAYITAQRVVVYWPGRHDGNGSIAWDELKAWGVRPDAPGGPLVKLEGADEVFAFHVVVRTSAMAEAAQSFLDSIRRRAGDKRRELSPAAHLGPPEDDSEVEVPAERLSLAAQTRRIIVSVLGIALVIAGLALFVLPGPGILVVVAGLALLASEYDWAKDARDWIRDKSRSTAQRFKKRSSAA